MKITLSVVLALIFLGCGEENKQVQHKTQTQEVQKQEVVKKSETVKKAETKIEAAKEEAKTKIEAAKEEAKTKIEAAKEEVKTKVASVDGKTLFKSCAGCHGANAEKKALGKSKVIKGWSISQTQEALEGYKAGTYGGSMKGIMKGQASKLSKEDIDALADYISTL